ncbi:uncharacterized protein LOC114214507 [Eumetopias jubatus]|uniref:uncharacterized protein LOC114214507 n=1 Tax=Eumetopias jubatus TaxID=34886 RepID=UPI0010166E6B|nr:uncharacterized protein LOC114214507 [Eumetopias jubatus]
MDSLWASVPPNLAEETGPSGPSRPRSDVTLNAVTVPLCEPLQNACQIPSLEPGPTPRLSGRPPVCRGSRGPRKRGRSSPGRRQAPTRPRWRAVTATARNSAHGPGSPAKYNSQRPLRRAGHHHGDQPGSSALQRSVAWACEKPCAEQSPKLSDGRSRAPTTQALVLRPEETESLHRTKAMGRRNCISQKAAGALRFRSLGPETVTPSCCQRSQVLGIWVPEAREQRSGRQRRRTEEERRMGNLVTKQH